MHIGYATWLGEAGLKAFVEKNGLPIQRNDEGNAWLVFGIDGPVVHETRILKDDGDEQTDFEACYDDLTALIAPRTSDGKPIYLPNLFPGDVTLCFIGRGDDPENANAKTTGAGRGEGQEFRASHAASGTVDVDFSFNDWVYLAGGMATWKGGVIGDWLSMKAIAPATVLTANGSNTGNCNLVQSVFIAPAPGNGAYDIDTGFATIVPAVDAKGNGIGYWDWNNPDAGYGTVTPNWGGAGYWNLYAVDIPLARFATEIPVLGDGSVPYLIPAIKPKKLLPQWRLRFTINNADGSHTLDLGWLLVVARMKTL